MENQEFDIELLEKKLEEYEQADSNVRSEEVLEFVKKVLDITLLQLSKGNVSDRDIEEDIRFVRDEIGKPDFLKQLVQHVQQALIGGPLHQKRKMDKITFSLNCVF